MPSLRKGLGEGSGLSIAESAFCIGGLRSLGLSAFVPTSVVILADWPKTSRLVVAKKRLSLEAQEVAVVAYKGYKLTVVA